MKTSIFKGTCVGALLSASSLIALPANAWIEAGLQATGPITTLTTPNIPTSMEEAIQRDFFFIFDSYYLPKDGGPWQGADVVLNRSIIQVPCRLQLGGYFWVTPPAISPQTIHVAVTHGRTDKPRPNGTITEACLGIQLSFNNGHVQAGFPAVSAGAWVGQLPQGILRTSDDTTAVPVAPAAPATVHNVQVNDGIIGNCTSGGTGTGGTGGTIGVRFNNNGPSVPASFDFNGNISGGGFFPCGVTGKLYSVIDKDPINNPRHTPGIFPNLIPNPSPLSFDKIDYVIQIPKI